MSYAILHMQKFKAGAVRGIQNHNERLTVSQTNPDINPKQSILNFNLHEHDNSLSYQSRIQKRIGELNLPKAVRKDAVVMCGFVCTSGSEFFEKLSLSRVEDFFRVSLDFLEERYGKNNIIASNVHMDEKTPHMHVYLTPVTSDGRLSSKSLFTRSELKNMHTAHHKRLLEKGFEIQRGQEGSPAKHIETSKLKLQTAELELNRINAEGSRNLQELLDRVKLCKDTLSLVDVEYEAKKAYVSSCNESLLQSNALPSYGKIKKRGLFDPKEFITIPMETWKENQVGFADKYFRQNTFCKFEQKLEDLKKSVSLDYVKELEQKLADVNAYCIQLQKDSNIDSANLRRQNRNLQESVSGYKLSMKILKNKVKRELDNFPPDVSRKLINILDLREDTSSQEKHFYQSF